MLNDANYVVDEPFVVGGQFADDSYPSGSAAVAAVVLYAVVAVAVDVASAHNVLS